MHRCYSAEVVINFSLWMEYRTLSQICTRPYFSNVSIQSSVVCSYIYGFFDGPGHIVSLPAYDSKVFC